MIMILVLIGIVLMVILSNNNNTANEKINRKDNATTTLSVDTIHLGGNPNLKQNQPVVFQSRSNGAIRMNLGIGLNINYQAINTKTIEKCEFKTEQQISKDITLTRLIGLGVFAFAFKKERKTTNTYMVLDYKVNNILVSCMFSAKDGQKLSKLVYKINEVIINNENALTS